MSLSCNWYAVLEPTSCKNTCAVRALKYMHTTLTRRLLSLPPLCTSKLTAQVVQGGPGTLATVESIALAGKPIVVLSDSGGAATAVHQIDRCRVAGGT
jgi:hypothetical protein